jgi:hypothetical protein
MQTQILEHTPTITCDEIIAERDRLTAAAIGKLIFLASMGTAMVVEEAKGLTLKHIFASWQEQKTHILRPDPQDCPSELQA